MTDFLSQMNLEFAHHDEASAILRHVQFLLNSKQGALAHIPDYGLPDFGTHPKQRCPRRHFIDLLQRLVYQYEPRIESLTIKEVESERADCILQLALTARLQTSEQLAFNTLLLSGGSFIVQDPCDSYE